MIKNFLRKLLAPYRGESKEYEAPDEIEPSIDVKPTPTLKNNCHGCVHMHSEGCLSPFEPRIYLICEGTYILCVDRVPWFNLAMAQMHQAMVEAWDNTKTRN